MTYRAPDARQGELDSIVGTPAARQPSCTAVTQVEASVGEYPSRLPATQVLGGKPARKDGAPQLQKEPGPTFLRTGPLRRRTSGGS